jgi:nicotinamidase-related amidase
MKRAKIIFIILAVVATVTAFSQDARGQERAPLKPALLVIDIQNAYLQYMPQEDVEVAFYYINNLIGLFRSNGFPVIRIYHHDKEMGPHPDTEQFEFPSRINIKSDDPRVIKTYADAFNKTDLDKVLKEKGCNVLFLCGLSAVGCVLATWNGAHNYDYQAFMVKDAIISHNTDYTNNVEDMFDAIGFDAVKLIVENSAK